MVRVIVNEKEAVSYQPSAFGLSEGAATIQPAMPTHAACPRKENVERYAAVTDS